MASSCNKGVIKGDILLVQSTFANISQGSHNKIDDICVGKIVLQVQHK